MRWEEQLPGGESLTAHEAANESALQRALRGLRPRRDYNGMRGPVPTRFRAHDWQTCRVMREAGDAWWESLGRAAVDALRDDLLRHRGRAR